MPCVANFSISTSIPLVGERVWIFNYGKGGLAIRFVALVPFVVGLAIPSPTTNSGNDNAGPGDVGDFISMPTVTKFAYYTETGYVTVEIESSTGYARARRSARTRALTLSMFVISWRLILCSTVGSVVKRVGAMEWDTHKGFLTAALEIPADLNRMTKTSKEIAIRRNSLGAASAKLRLGSFDEGWAS